MGMLRLNIGSGMLSIGLGPKCEQGKGGQLSSCMLIQPSCFASPAIKALIEVRAWLALSYIKLCGLNQRNVIQASMLLCCTL